jgi:hypothetical protein
MWMGLSGGGGSMPSSGSRRESRRESSAGRAHVGAVAGKVGGGGVTCSRRRTQNPDIAGPDRAEGTKGIGDRAQELP